MNDKSIFKRQTCPVCKKQETDQTGKDSRQCVKCGVSMTLSDKWYVRLTVNGKAVIKAVSSRRAEAVEYLHAAKDAARRGQLLPGEEETISWQDAKEAIAKWINTGTLATGTKENYHGQLKHLDKFFSEDLQNITVRRVEEYRDSRTAKPKTIAEEIKLLKRIFSLYCRWHSARTAPTLHAVAADLAKVEMPRYNNKRLRFLTEKEVQLLFDNCTVPHLKLAITIALSTGLRLRNICYLEWKQIDFINRTITFKPEDMKSKRLHISPLMAHLVTYLVTWRKEQAKTAISPYVFPSPVDGQPVDNMRTSWVTLLKKCNLGEDVVFHTLRHTFASHFLMNGGDLSTLSELLDHSSIQITKDRYGHLSDAHKKAAIDQFSTVFFKVA